MCFLGYFFIRRQTLRYTNSLELFDAEATPYQCSIGRCRVGRPTRNFGWVGHRHNAFGPTDNIGPRLYGRKFTGKLVKTDATRCQIITFKAKMHQIPFRCGAPDPAGGAYSYSAPQKTP